MLEERYRAHPKQLGLFVLTWGLSTASGLDTGTATTVSPSHLGSWFEALPRDLLSVSVLRLVGKPFRGGLRNHGF